MLNKNHQQRNHQQRAGEVPPIPLTAQTSSNDDNTEKHVYKCRQVPNDKNSPQFEETVNTFNDGSPEQWISTQKKLKIIERGQNLIRDEQRIQLVDDCIAGRAKTAFQNAIQDQPVNQVTLKKGLRAVTEEVFPRNAARIQKRWLRRYLNKPKNMSTRDFIARVCEINNCFPYFPSRYTDDGTPYPEPKLEDDELLDILYQAMPKPWQIELTKNGFDLDYSSIDDLRSLCECYEQYEAQIGTMQVPNYNSNENINNKKRSRDDEQDSDGNDRPNKKFEGRLKKCMLHGTGKHSSDECNTLKAQAENMKAIWAAKRPQERKEYKKKEELRAAKAILRSYVEKERKRHREPYDDGDDNVTDEELGMIRDLSESDSE
jgi:hypothetical protein